MLHISPKRTICEVLREISSGPDITPEMKAKCWEATLMAKKMDVKLREYKTDWDAGFWQKNPKYTYEVHMQNLLRSGNDGNAA